MGGVLFMGAQTKQSARAEPAPDIDWHFIEAVKNGKIQTSVILQKLHKISAADSKSESSLFFDDLFAAACARADRSQTAELAKIAAEQPNEALRFTSSFTPLSGAYFRDWIDRLSAERPTPPAFPKVNLPPPEQLAGAPTELLEAWTLYQSVVTPFRELAKAEAAKQYPAGGDFAALERGLRKLLSAPEPGIWRELLKCDNRGPCGTGSEMLYHPRNRGILLSLLADGRLAEAAGMSLNLTPDMLNRESASPEIARFLPVLGLDWEALYVGSLLPDPGSHFGYNSATHRPVVVGWGREHDPWSALAALGSDRGVLLCVTLIRHIDPDPFETVRFLGTALGPELQDPNRFTISSPPELKRTKPVSPNVRGELLKVLTSYLAPTRPASEIDQALTWMPETLAPELHTPLGVLAANPSRLIASKARDLLVKGGVTTNLPPLQPAPTPVLRRLLANGQPLSGVEVSAVAYPIRRQLGEKVTSNEDGLLRLPLDELLTPEALKKIKISSHPRSAVPIDVLLKTGNDKPAPRDATDSTPWFAIETDAFATETAPRDLSIPLAPLEIRVIAKNKEADGRSAEIQLRHYTTPDAEDAEYDSGRLAVQVGGTGRFTRLQPGVYAFSVKADGCAYFDSKKFAVREEGTVIPVTLERGISVTSTLIFPNGERRGFEWMTKLLRDGVELPRYTWLGAGTGEQLHDLPAGRYRAILEAAQENVSLEDRYGRFELEFELTSDSPAKVDLGEHKIPRRD